MSAITMVDGMGVRAVAAPAVRRRPARATAGAGENALRLTLRGRLVLAALVAMLGGAAVIAAPGLLSGATADSPVAPAVVEIYTVAPGESMWQVARGVTAPGQDVRDTVAAIVELNGLQSVDLQIGQQLLLPAGGS